MDASIHAGLVSEYTAAVNVLTHPAYCRTLRKPAFILCFPHFDLDRVGRRPF